MTVEITISSIADWVNTNYGIRMFETAQYFSGSTNFNIIDSYSSSATPNRYNGDPIADGKWTSGSDVNNDNSWFVIECITSLHSGLSIPNWQAKYQWSNVAFDDCSGLDYDMESDTNVIALRFAAYGGWDLDPSTPDFTGPSGQKSGKNKKIAPAQGIGVYLLRNIFYEDDGQFMWLMQNGSVGSDQLFYTLTTVIGDFSPIDLDSHPMPRLHINGFNDPVTGVIATDSWLCEDSHWSNSSPTTWTDTNLGIGYENPSGTWTEEGFKSKTTGIIVNRYSQPAPHRSPLDTTIKPYQICTYSSGPIGEIPGLGKMYGIGQALFDERNWISLGKGLSLAMKWNPLVNF